MGNVLSLCFSQEKGQEEGETRLSHLPPLRRTCSVVSGGPRAASFCTSAWWWCPYLWGWEGSDQDLSWGWAGSAVTQAWVYL